MFLKDLPNFPIRLKGNISKQFLERGLNDFHQTIDWVAHLPYGRTSKRSQYKLVLSEEKGTCSTKHALLAKLSSEQGREDIKLFTGIYEMNKVNTPEIGEVLGQYDLEAIPEAHCYLKYGDERFDFTRVESMDDPIDSFLIEKEITPLQIGDFKFAFHRVYIAKWLREKELADQLTVDQIWGIREECVGALTVQ
ncbi:hypothetical protein [Alkalibacillus aidingensis]|uniref:hypothetical protein n=1 Tax=Alkalibacillus aidingensis TaxID=2747607 RepID=UPI001661068B|nr:hypothetical protein [Alkalibacillus aidingensis]